MAKMVVACEPRESNWKRLFEDVHYSERDCASVSTPWGQTLWSHCNNGVWHGRRPCLGRQCALLHVLMAYVEPGSLRLVAANPTRLLLE